MEDGKTGSGRGMIGRIRLQSLLRIPLPNILPNLLENEGF
jgi:hypothetical protein